MARTKREERSVLADPANKRAKATSEGPRDQPRSYVYFARVWGTTTWKIGVSKNPQKRVRALQTANQQLLCAPYVIPDADRAVEGSILRYTGNYRCRKGRGGTEWREGLTTKIIKTIIRRITSEGVDFLGGAPLLRNLNG